MTVFGDVNVSVYGNSDVLKFTFTFKCVLLENQKCNYFNRLLYIAALYLRFIPVSFIKFNTLSLSWYFLQNSRKVLFQAATLQRCPETVGISILSLFGNELNKFNNTGAGMLDSIYHMTLRSL